MSEPETEGILSQIDRRLTALASVEKRLKKRSTISFVERRDLSGKAAKAAVELKARREELTGAEPAEGEAIPEPVQKALDAADKILGQIDGAQPGTSARHDLGGAKKPLAQQRGAAGGSQTRGPDRIGE
jgi:hypothetical protein